MDHASNGIFLPVRGKEISALPWHTGYHSAYSKAVKKQLDKMDVTLDIAVLEPQVAKLQQKLRQLIEQGTPLYSASGAHEDLWERLLDL